MSRIVVKQISKQFGKVQALQDVSLLVEEGEFLTILGPSGCGKTTTLRCLAGLEMPDSGEIYFGDRCVYSVIEGVDVPPRERSVGLVFQNYALYPHMNVFKNVGFGLRNQKVGKHEIQRRVMEVLELVGLTGLEDRMPRELSGGQQQRVALARMIVSRPRIFLFDEPLSNLDVKLRMGLRAELKKMHRTLGATSVYVTHDQQEAMTLSDRIVVMRAGQIEQIGSAADIYHFPETTFVAQFTGNPKTNLLEGSIRRVGAQMSVTPVMNPRASVPIDGMPEVHHGQDVILNIRPEDVMLELYPRSDDLKFEVYATLDSGAETLVYLRTPENTQMVLRARSADHHDLQREQVVAVRFRRGNLYDRDTLQLVDSFGFTRHRQLVSGMA